MKRRRDGRGPRRTWKFWVALCVPLALFFLGFALFLDALHRRFFAMLNEHAP